MQHTTTNYHLATEKDFSTLAEFIAKYNSIPSNESLHCGTEAAKILEEIKDHHSRLECRFLMAYDEQQQLIGVFGGDCDATFVRCWLWGPFVAGTENWDTVAEGLYQHFLAITPAAEKLAAYNRIQNQQTIDFYERQGFKKAKNQIFVYEVEKTQHKKDLTPKHVCIDYDSQYFEVLNTLHNKAFPDTYYTTEEMVNLDDNFRIWVHLDGANLAGYILANTTPNGEGYVHFLAVDEAYRKQGIGRSLLIKAVNYLFVNKQLPKISLTVTATNHARNLYESVGFEAVCIGISQNLKLG